MLRTEFWQESAEALQAKLDAALDGYAKAIAYANTWKGDSRDSLTASALNHLVYTLRPLGFTAADALRWGRARLASPRRS